MTGLQGQRWMAWAASHCHNFHHPMPGPWCHPHLTPAGKVTGSSARLPGVGRSRSGQPRARVLQRTLPCNTCSLRSESSSHRKAPAASACPGQGAGQGNQMNWGEGKGPCVSLLHSPGPPEQLKPRTKGNCLPGTTQPAQKPAWAFPTLRFPLCWPVHNPVCLKTGPPGSARLE